MGVVRVNKNSAAYPVRSCLAPAGPIRPVDLTVDDFKPGRQTPGTPSALARYTVPEGQLLMLNGLRPFRFHLSSYYDFPDTYAQQNALFIPFAQGAMQTQRYKKPGEYTNHLEVKTYVKTVGTPDSNYSLIESTIENFETGGADFAVTFDTTNLPDDNLDFRIYFVTGVGSMRIVAAQPAGVDARSLDLYNDTLRGLNERNQTHEDEAPRLVDGGAKGYVLAPKWQLVIEVNSRNTFEWSPRAHHVVQIPCYTQAVRVYDEEKLNQIVSKNLR